MFYNKGLCDQKYLEADGNMSTSKSGKFTTYKSVDQNNYFKLYPCAKDLSFHVTWGWCWRFKIEWKQKGQPLQNMTMRPYLQNVCHCELLSRLIFWGWWCLFSSEGETGRGALLRSTSAAIDRLAGKGGGGGGTTDLLLVLGGGGEGKKDRGANTTASPKTPPWGETES